MEYIDNDIPTMQGLICKKLH